MIIHNDSKAKGYIVQLELNSPIGLIGKGDRHLVMDGFLVHLGKDSDFVLPF